MQNLKVEFLANRPDLLPILAEWTIAAWGKYDPTLNQAGIFEGLEQKCNTTKLPIGFVLLLNNEAIGMAALKSSVKLKGYDNHNLWLGSFWINPKYKNDGAGIFLLHAVLDKARELGFKKIHDFESNPEDAEWLMQHKWLKFKTDEYQGHPITVLEYTL